jgi:dethiobiotin synthetase
MTKPSFFITGTDTSVGKTEAACLLARSLTEAGLKVGVMKPVETGCPVKDGRIMPLDALRLKTASNTEADLDLVNPYRFTAPVAPDLAARLFGTSIDLERIKDIFIGLQAAHDLMLVEGAGGLLAPCAEGKSMADLAHLLGTSLIIVTANRLGTINHTLLTVRCAQQMVLAIKGIILNNPAPSENDPSAGHNRSDIERLTGVPVVFEIPYCPDPACAPKLLKKYEVEKLLFT